MRASKQNRLTGTSGHLTGKLTLAIATALVVIGSIGEAGITRSGITRGRIAAFGSIFVNGREIDTSQALFFIDGEPAVEANLRLGQIAEVSGAFDDEDPVGTATIVDISDSVEGPVQSVDPDNNRLTVLGQTVIVDVETVFDLQPSGNGLDDIRAGDVVEVSGLVNAAAEILATRIERKAAGGEFEVEGVVTNLTATTFTLNALTVDFSNAELRDFPTGMISVGDNVEAKGTPAPSGVLLARRVEFEGGIPVANGDFVDVEGIITEFTSASDFKLGSLPITTDATTIFENGAPGNLASGRQIEVTGIVNENGVVEAIRVRLEQAKIKIEATVNAVGDEQFEVLGIVIAPTDETRWRDKSDADVDDFSLSDLSVGDFVELRSFKNPSQDPPVIPQRVRREDEDDEVELQGFVTRDGRHGFQIMGVTIDTGGRTEYESADGEEIDAESFFEAALRGTLVEVEGEQTASDRIFAEELEIE